MIRCATATVTVRKHYRVREQIAVRDAEPVAVDLRFTRHGPVVYEEPGSGRLWAVRAAWLHEAWLRISAASTTCAPRIGMHSSLPESVGRPEREPGMHADVDGNIGYKPAGLLPRRRDHDGLLPVPGDGRYEWDDFHDMDALPVEFNPPRGFVATANALTLPADYPIDEVRVALNGPHHGGRTESARCSPASPSIGLRTRLRCSGTTFRCRHGRSRPPSAA